MKSGRANKEDLVGLSRVCEFARAYNAVSGAHPSLPKKLPAKKFHLPAIFPASLGDK